jgi:hypothetical protein
MFHYTTLKSLGLYKPSRLLGPSVSYKLNEVYSMWFQQPYLQHFIFFIAYEWTQQARVFVLGKFFVDKYYVTVCHIRLICKLRKK